MAITIVKRAARIPGVPNCPSCRDPMILNGGGLAAAGVAVFWACLNCRRTVTLEELRHIRRMAAERAAAIARQRGRR